MKVILDGTPLLGVRTGIGRYTQELVSRLPDALRAAEQGSSAAITLWSARGRQPADLPRGIEIVGPSVPARGLRAAWLRGNWPPIEMLVGAHDVFHGTNFVSPPTRNAAEVVTIHDLTYVHHAQTVAHDALQYRQLVPRALDRGAQVVSPTAAVAAAVRALYHLPANRVHVTPLGVDEEWFHAKAPHAHWLDRQFLPARYLLFVGSIDPRKNLTRLLEAHAEARLQDPDVPDLVLAGPAGRTEIDPTSGVHTTGWLDQASLMSIVAGSHGLVLPSLDEGFGLPVLEALACGRPVVVSEIPALTEVADHSSITCDPLDITSMSNALIALTHAPDGAAERASRRAWAQAFTWERTAELTVEAYRQAIAQR